MSDTSGSNPLDAEWNQVRQQAMEFSGIGLYRFTFDGTVLAIDGGALRVFELDDQFPAPEAAVGKNIAELVEYLGTPGLMRKEIRRARRVHAREWNFRTLKGNERWVLEDAYVVRDAHVRKSAVQVVIRDITDRKRVELALLQREEQSRSMLDAMADPIHLVDLELRVVSINQALRSLMRELDLPGEVLGKTVFELFPFLPANVRDEYRRVWETAETLSTEETVRVSGREFMTETRKIPVTENGRVIGVLTVVHDATERKRAERALRESEAKYRNILDNMQEGYYEVNLAGSFTFVNQALCRIFGYSEPEVLGLNYQQYYPDEATAAQAREIYGRVYETGVPVQLSDWEVVRKDGHRAVLEVSVALMRNTAGHRVGFCGIARDITDRKRAEAALRESEQRYRELFEDANDIVYTHDLAGQFTSLNKAGEQISGYARDEVIRLNVMDFIAPPYLDLARSMVARKLAGETPTRYEVEIIAKGGRRVPIEVSTRLVVKNGQPVGIQGIVRDITDRRRAEEEHRRLEAQILHAQKLEGLGVLAGGIAHDFNNLLVGMLGYADLALTKIPAETPAHGYVEKIESSARRAAELTNQMLAYSGRGKFVVRPIDVSRLVQEVGHLLTASISKKATLRYDCPEGLPPVVGDATQLHQVIMNLITNASDALGDSPGVVTLRTRVMHIDQAYLSGTYLNDALPDGRYVCIEVSDTGCGMDPATLARIFDPFFSTKFTGRGLGLAAVLGIVRGHQGAIKVYSEPGQGTTFKVLFPAEDGGAQDGSASDASGNQGLDDWRGRGVLLVADDEETARSVAREFAQGRGFSVLEAADGREAIEVFRAHADEISAVLLDLTMPVLNGQQALERILDLRPGVPIIVSSGYTEQDVVSRFAGKRPTAFVQKPYVLRDLASKMREVLDPKPPV